MLIEGPLAPWVSAIEARLSELGYADETARQHRRLVAKLSRFLAERRLGVADVTSEVLERFCLSLRRVGHGSRPTIRSFGWLISLLRELGELPLTESIDPKSDVDVLIGRYRRFVLDERGLMLDTVENYERPLRVFIAEAGCEVDTWTAADVSRFMTLQARQTSARGLERSATSLRSFLRFALVEGLTDKPLAHAVPSAARWSVAGLPRGLAPGEVTALLGSCDRDTPKGRRDFAVMVLLVRLGLRAAEVAGLRLDDIDWRAGELVVRGKGGTEERLPLPVDVGDAVSAYLEHDRPRRPDRAVFLRIPAPLRGLAPEGVSEIVRTAGERVGLGSFGSHRLRHTAATQMLRSGASLTDVGQVLRHRCVLTTAIYAKVDHDALRALALPWPGGVQ